MIFYDEIYKKRKSYFSFKNGESLVIFFTDRYSTKNRPRWYKNMSQKRHFASLVEQFRNLCKIGCAIA